MRSSRRRSIARAAAVVAVAFALTCSRPLAQADFSGVEIKVTPVAGPIYMLTGAGGNIGVSVGPEGILIVDDQFAPLADKIRAALSGLGEGKLRFVLNTHFHGDHTGGNAAFSKEATIIAHHNTRKRLATPQQVGGQTTEASPKEALPIITFGKDLTLFFNGDEIQAIHLPEAHTDGDVAVYFSGWKVAHLGDVFFSGRFPFVDMASGGSVDGLIRDVDDLLANLPTDVKIIPGHGPLSTLEDLRNYRKMLFETRQAVKGYIAKGMSVEEAKKAGVPEAWKSWAWEFVSADSWIELLYKSATAKPAASSGH